MRTVELEAGGGQLSELVDAAVSGEEIVIERAGRPVAKIVPVSEGPKKPRQLGTLRGKYNVPENFDDPLPDWLLDEFEGR